MDSDENAKITVHGGDNRLAGHTYNEHVHVYQTPEQHAFYRERLADLYQSRAEARRAERESHARNLSALVELMLILFCVSAALVFHLELFSVGWWLALALALGSGWLGWKVGGAVRDARADPHPDD